MEYYNANNMSYMFRGCESLSSLPDISKWNINNVNNMSCMFERCSSLLSLPDILKWNTNNVINMSCMFGGCKSLSSFPENFKIFIKTITGKTIFIYYLFDESIQNIKN